MTTDKSNNKIPSIKSIRLTAVTKQTMTLMRKQTINFIKTEDHCVSGYYICYLFLLNI